MISNIVDVVFEEHENGNISKYQLAHLLLLVELISAINSLR